MTRAAASGERLSRADEANLVLDRVGVYVLTVAGVLGAGGIVRGLDDIDLVALRRIVTERIERMPRLRRTLVGRPARHALVERPLRITDHVRLVDPVDGRAGLQRLCERLSAQHLPPDRPLWELLLVPGAHPAGIGWVFRVHHALADGTTAARLMDGLFDADPHTRADAPAAPGAPSTPPAVAASGSPAPTGTTPWSRQLADLVRPLPRTALIGPSGLGRTSRVIAVDLAALSRAAHGAGGTVNDAVLAAVAEGARAAYAELGEQAPPALPVSVPVLLPAGDGRANQVSGFTVRVPLAPHAVADRIRTLAPLTRAAAADARTRAVPWFSGTLTGARVMRWFVTRQRMIAVLSTNVRGPSRAARLGGAPIEAVWALPVIVGTVRVGVAAVSYAEVLSVCLLWADELGTAGVALADAVEAALGELIAATEP